MRALTCFSPLVASAPGAVADDGALTNLFALPDPTCAIRNCAGITIRLDDSDRVIDVPASWDAFAAQAGLAGLERATLLGHPVYSFIADETVRELFRALFRRVRQEARQLTVRSRCDSLEVSRSRDLAFVPDGRGVITCSWNFFEGQAAAMLPRRHRLRFQCDDAIRECSWCRSIHAGTTWHPLEEIATSLGMLDRCPLPPITHGICPDCCRSLCADFHREVHERITA